MFGGRCHPKEGSCYRPSLACPPAVLPWSPAPRPSPPRLAPVWDPPWVPGRPLFGLPLPSAVIIWWLLADTSGLQPQPCPAPEASAPTGLPAGTPGKGTVSSAPGRVLHCHVSGQENQEGRRSRSCPLGPGALGQAAVRGAEALPGRGLSWGRGLCSSSLPCRPQPWAAAGRPRDHLPPGPALLPWLSSCPGAPP